MFGEQFYPTPPEVVDMLMEPFWDFNKPYTDRYYGQSLYGWNVPCKSILDPSAGKGDILRRVVEKTRERQASLSAIEIDPSLRLILSAEGFAVRGSDFLTYNEPFYYDLILMNPPFADGDKHLWKAWELVADGGNIGCILNAETINNPYSKLRQNIVELVSNYGSMRFIGRAFANSENPTDVECVIVWLKKPAKEKGWDFAGEYRTEQAMVEDNLTANQLANSDILQAIVDQYEAACKALVAMNKHARAYNFFTNGVVRETKKQDAEPKTLNEQITELKKSFWDYIFQRTKLGEVTTSNFRKRFEAFTAGTQNMSFCKENILEVLDVFFQTRHVIMQECLVHVFDQATAYHAKNMVHVEGWKTNKAYRVNRRIIMPNGVSFDATFGTFGHSYASGRTGEFLDDLDKVMCFISGREVAKINRIHTAINTHTDAYRRRQVHYSDWFESEFFRIKIFKKGTVHLDFKDEVLWEELNRQAAAGKKWIGDGE